MQSFLPDLEKRKDNRRTLAFRDEFANIWLLVLSPRRLKTTTAGEEIWLDRDAQKL
ncbi:MAG: hypothetical protein WCI05_13540 [Myxococcales bacterium]